MSVEAGGLCVCGSAQKRREERRGDWKRGEGRGEELLPGESAGVLLVFVTAESCRLELVFGSKYWADG